jgi:hypothetical protein
MNNAPGPALTLAAHEIRAAQGSPLSTTQLTGAATRLYAHIYAKHWNGEVLAGPDPGIRFNARIFRFPKSYLSFIPWRDELVYMQAQKYWIDDNLLVAELGIGADIDPREVAAKCARAVRRKQRAEGYWEYPNPEWRGRIATVEGNYGAVALLLAHRDQPDADLLAGAVAWHDYVVNKIGFQAYGDSIAVNYFGNLAGGRIPNNSASTIRAFAMLAHASGEDRYLETCPGMIRYLAEVQLDSGELPYATLGVTGKDRPHFLCYQYNAFQFLNIADYYQLTLDPQVLNILKGLASYLAASILPTGACRYDCRQTAPEVIYYTAAAGAALSEAAAMGLGDYRKLADRAFLRVLSQQQVDGSFPYSLRNHRFLSDRRSYPRQLSMLLNHLLLEVRRRRAQ